MSPDWRKTTWGELATLEYGRALRGDLTDRGCRVFGTNGPIGWVLEPLTTGGTVIVGRKGAYRGVHLSLEPCWVIDTAFYLVPKRSLDIRWAYYQLLTQDINRLDSGSAIPSTSRADFSSLPVLVPPLPEQHRIASVLGTLDDKIDLNRRMNRTLEDLAATLFRAWFVDFEPVRAKLEGRQPVGIDAATAALFPDRLVDSAVGAIPEGWQAGTIGDVVWRRGETVDPELIASDTPYIGLEHLPRKSIAVVDWAQASTATSTKSTFQKGDILFGKLRPYFHKVAVAPMSGICSTDILVLAPSRSDLFGLALGYLSSDEVVAFAAQGADGTRMPRTSWTYLANYPIVLPPVAVTGRFTDTISPLIDRINVNIEQSRMLAQLRDLLLPGLLSGEIRVPEAARAVVGVG